MKNKSFVITNKPTVSEMLGIIGKTQMLIGMRLHALIFAASLGIPWWEWCTNPRLKVLCSISTRHRRTCKLPGTGTYEKNSG